MASAGVMWRILGIATVVSAVNPPRLPAQCQVILTATGVYQLIVTDGLLLPLVETKDVSGPTFADASWGGSDKSQCSEEARNLTRPNVYPSPNASAEIFAVAQTLYKSAIDIRERPFDQYAYDEFAYLASVASTRQLTDYIKSKLADLALVIIQRYANPTSLLTNKGARWVADRAVKLILKAYLDGSDDLDTVVQSLLDDILKDLTSQTAGYLVRTLVGSELDELRKALAPLLKRIALDIKNMLGPSESAEQSVRVEIQGTKCTHTLEIFWKPRGGMYRGTATIQCGRQEKAVYRVTPNPPRIDVVPDGRGTFQVTAYDHKNVPLPLASATVSGLAAVMPTGSLEPTAQIVGTTATFTFRAANPRRDKPYPVTIRIITDRSTGSLAGQTSATVVVKNVAPIMETPQGTSAKPGELLDLRPVQLSVIDGNADERNPGEVSVDRLSLAHPYGLETSPPRAFDKPDSPRLVSFDPTSGRYVFEFSQAGTVKDPHRDGVWGAIATIRDDAGLAGSQPIKLEVLDTDPVVEYVRPTPQFVHAGDEKKISVTARFKDKNKYEDLVAWSIDATQAGGGLYSKDNGLIEVGRGLDWVEVRVVQPFPHLDDKQLPIKAEVKDEKNSSTSTDFVYVGNIAPVIGGSGYIHDGPRVGAVPGGGVSLEPLSNLRPCPNQVMTVGVIISDPEQDQLIVTATILETGQTAELKNSSGNIWTGNLQAPKAPGTYTLLFAGRENRPDGEGTTEKLPLEVQPCDEVSSRVSVPGAPVNPTALASLPRDPSQLFLGALPGGVVEPTRTPPFESSQLEDALTEALGSGPSDALPGIPAPEVEAYFLALGGSTGPVIQLFALNRTGQPVRLEATSIVLEPVRISAEAQTRIGTILQDMVDAGAAPQIVNGYCLEFTRLPPLAGTVLRMASAPVQQRFARYQRLLNVAKRIVERGLLHPDTDADSYLHAIQQWAIWTVEQRFDAQSFPDAFIAKTRLNHESSGGRWTRQVEQSVRALVPNRWNDIQAMLREAVLP